MKYTKRPSRLSSPGSWGIQGRHRLIRIAVLSGIIVFAIVAIAIIPRRLMSESFMDSDPPVPIDPPVPDPPAPPPDPTPPPSPPSLPPTYTNNNNVTINSPPPQTQYMSPQINSLNGHTHTHTTVRYDDYYERRRPWQLYDYYDYPRMTSPNWWGWWPRYPLQEQERVEEKVVETKSDMTTIFVAAAIGAGIALVLISAGALVAMTSGRRK